jgi:ornithine cyclodeaminase/alanine dehydrogenase-like protein (mu-crystallin family)
MAKTLYLNNEDVARLLDVKSCVSALENAYKDLAQGDAVNRPKTYVVVPDKAGVSYSYCTMEGADRNLGVMAIRMKSDMNRFVEVYGKRRAEKWAARPGKFCGLVLLFSTHSGELLAILNDGLIQQMRVGATSGLAAKYLARDDAAVLGMVGSGGQARSHARAFAAVRPLKTLKVYSPNPEHRQTYAEEMGRELGIEVFAVNSAEEAVAGADIVSACTTSLEPVIRGEWLSSGAHATKVNANELDDDFFTHVDVVIRHQILDTKIYAAGTKEEARAAPKATRKGRVIAHENVPTLDELILGRAPGRISQRQVTFFDNNEGNGLQFATCGALAYQRALEKGLGRELPSEWFLQDLRD